MNSIHVIAPLSLSSAGPWSTGGPVHLRQGDADGACGPYCILMGLLACGLIERDQATGTSARDARTRLGRVWAKFGDLGPLITNGTNDDDLEEIIAAFGPSVGLATPPRLSPAALNEFIVSSLLEDQPVIVGIDIRAGQRHWVLAVGIDDSSDTLRLLVLDPGGDMSPLACWNAVIELSMERRRYPSQYWSQQMDGACVVEAALAIVPRRQ